MAFNLWSINTGRYREHWLISFGIPRDQKQTSFVLITKKCMHVLKKNTG